jgi:hAT family C-terminal dimerisation region
MKDDQIDILEYWKRNATVYPTLAMMARDVFTVSVSTVPSELCFSSINMILTDKHTKLGSKLFNQLVYNKDLMMKVTCNMISHLRQQHPL